MRVLVWQWGRRGAGPLYAAELAANLGRVPGVTALLSLSAQAELLGGASPPECVLPFSTYTGLLSLLLRLPALPVRVALLARRLRSLVPDVAICAMPAALDLVMAAALARIGVPFFVVVHDADPHPGDGIPLQMPLQRALIRRAFGLMALSGHVADRLRALGLVGDRPLIMTRLPPFVFGAPPPPPRAHGGRLRLLSFGRLLPYKGLDLLADAIARLGRRDDMELRVVGSGPESPELDRLRALPGTTVENRWVPEAEVGAILAWADALVLSHREASQSGVAAAAIAARRWVVATRVGGIAEQLEAEPLARLCDPAPDSLADALRGLLADPPRRQDTPDPAQAWREVATGMAAGLRAALARRDGATAGLRAGPPRC
jgi:glycosyltransferase involved in cell wall biosynthesis